MPSFDDYYQEGVRGVGQSASNDRRAILLQGEVPNLGASTVDLQTQGGTTVLPPSAAALTVTSSDANDTFGGSGLEAVLIRGLDSDYGNGGLASTLPFYEEVVLTAGLSAANGQIPLRRVQFAMGVLGTAVGTITIAIGGVTQLVVAPSSGFSKSFVHTCPSGYITYLGHIGYSWSATPPVTITLRATLEDGTLLGDFASASNQHNNTIGIGISPLTPRTDMKVTAIRPSGGGTDNLEGTQEAWLQRI